MANKDEVTRKAGYIYSPGTAQGFLRMQRQGIPRPLFSIETKLTKQLQSKYSKILKQILKDFKRQAKLSGLSASELTQDGEDETLENLIAFFEEMARQEKEAREAQEKANLKAKLQTTLSNMESEWDREDEEDEIPDLELEHHLADILLENQKDYAQRLEKDAGPKAQSIFKSFALDKNEVYEANLENIRKIYLDNALQRIHGEETELKHQFIERIRDYITDQTETLDIEDITRELFTSTTHMARFFARDQLARFNKATTLSTFVSAGVTKVKWVTTHDVRVRPTHKALDGQVFDIRNLPPEIDDYNCRCGLVPVAWADD